MKRIQTRIQIRMKTTRDTRHECNRLDQMWQLYFEGRTRPHFPVPALIYTWDVYPKTAWLFVRWEELGLSQDKEQSDCHVLTIRGVENDT